MRAEILHMSDQEQSRAEVICLYIEGHIKQKVAAKRVGLGKRQVRRLAKEFRLHGAKALIHGNRGKVSNRKIRDDFNHCALQRTVVESQFNPLPFITHLSPTDS